MKKNLSLKQQLLIAILSFIILGMGILFYTSYNSLKISIDNFQDSLYSHKIDNIIYLINQKEQKLQKTGMPEAYKESFQDGTVKIINDVFSKHKEDIYPFIIDKDSLFILHPELNKKNNNLYRNDKAYEKLIKMKSGSFDYSYNKTNKWTIFKYYEPWGWIIGYAVHKDTKYQKLNKFKNDFISSSILVLIAISLIIIYIVKRVLMPISNLTKVSKEISSGKLDAKISVDGARELNDLSENFDIMRNKILEDIKKLKEHDERIQGFNEELKKEVQERTQDLQESNDELETMIENLRKTQNKLVESEKLAGLGSLVASVAHEINTPVGVGLAGSSHLEYLNEEINEKYSDDDMSKEEFEEYLKSSTDLIKVINANLGRTAEIIRNFKQVAVDQTSEQKRVFSIKEYIRGVLISIDSIIKKKNVEIKLECPDDLEITSYPGFYAQIITNLLANSITHAYEKNDKGVIKLIVKSDDNYLYLEYSDDGKGINEKNLTKIFEPFFTTNRDAGGSGLGLNIVYNLITTNLKGSIDCKSEIGKGTTFIIKTPL